MSRSVLILLSFVLPAAVSAADFLAEPSVSQDVLNRYVAASQAQQLRLQGMSMEVAISAEVPKLHKTGRMHALRHISRLGKITYDALRFEGDNTVKKEVIARYLAAETGAADTKNVPVTPEFYKFKYKGLTERDGQSVHVFQLTPKKKSTATFKGELWLDPETFLTVRESGRLAKSPSVFIRSFDFVRTYQIRDGVALPLQTSGIVNTRLWGKAEMKIDFSNYAHDEDRAICVADEFLAGKP